jgi:hypothetical protein
LIRVPKLMKTRTITNTLRASPSPTTPLRTPNSQRGEMNMEIERSGTGKYPNASGAVEPLANPPIAQDRSSRQVRMRGEKASLRILIFGARPLPRLDDTSRCDMAWRAVYSSLNVVSMRNSRSWERISGSHGQDPCGCKELYARSISIT